jgi:hypothetical protein
MQKNVGSQKLIVFAFDSTTNLPKSGDAANLTAYVSKDWGSVTVLGDTSATEMDATNAKGYYLFDLTQSETNANCLLFSAKSSTSNIVVLGAPATVFTTPANFATAVIDSNGLADSTVVKLGPSGAATAQTARDIGASVLLSPGTGTGQVNLSSGAVPSKGNIKKNTALTGYMFLMTDSTNHNPVTGKSVTVTRAIDGAAFAAGTLSAVTEVGSGIYTVDFGAGDLNGNSIVLLATASGCDNTYRELTTFVA